MSVKEQPLSDSVLLEQYRTTHEGRYLGELYRRYSALVLGVCIKYLKNLAESEDAVMEIFEKLHLDLKTVKVDYFKAWIHTVTRNHCLMKLRKAGLPTEFPEEFPPPQYLHRQDESADDISEKVWNEQLLTQLAQHLKALKAEQRLCLELFYLQQKSYKQVADATQMTLNEVKTHIQNGKSNLKKHFKR